MKLFYSIALIVVIVGAINWGIVGVSGNDLVGMACGPGSMLARLAYMLVGVFGLALACMEIAKCGVEHRGTCQTT